MTHMTSGGVSNARKAGNYFVHHNTRTTRGLPSTIALKLPIQPYIMRAAWMHSLIAIKQIFSIFRINEKSDVGI